MLLDGIHRTVEQLRQCRGLGYAPIAVCPQFSARIQFSKYGLPILSLFYED